jgi:drug/metabolite transporter, DME family
VLSVAIIFLSLGADAANQAIGSDEAIAVETLPKDGLAINEATAPDHNALSVSLGIAAAVFSGIAFAVLTVGVRKVATSATAPLAIVFYINLMGILFLGSWSLQRLGIKGMLATTPYDLATMLGVGAFNLLGFLLLTKALQLATVVRVNIIANSLTMALTVLAGIVMFNEPTSTSLFLGLILTLAGVVIIGLADTDEGQHLSEEKTGVFGECHAAESVL